MPTDDDRRGDSSYAFLLQDAIPCLSLSIKKEDQDIPFAPVVVLPNDQKGISEDVLAQPVFDAPGRPLRFPRPEFLYVRAIKTSHDSLVGLSFIKKKEDGPAYVSDIMPEGLFYKCGIHIGDKLISINNVDFSVSSLKDISDAIQASKPIISFCLQNEGGDPHFVLNSVQKPARGMKVGIYFKRERGALIVSKVHENGLFASTLLMPEHRCYQINGEYCYCKNAHEAALITTSAERVTILSGAQGNLAAVLSIGPNIQARKKPFLHRIARFQPRFQQF